MFGPNILGDLEIRGASTTGGYVSSSITATDRCFSVFSRSDTTGKTLQIGTVCGADHLSFPANKVSNLFGNSVTLQPESLRAILLIRF